MVLENVQFHIENSTIVLQPNPGHTGRIAHNLREIIREVRSSIPSTQQCDRVKLLVAGEYIEISIHHLEANYV